MVRFGIVERMLCKMHCLFMVACLVFVFGFGVYRFLDWRADGAIANLLMAVVCAVISIGLLLYLCGLQRGGFWTKGGAPDSKR